MLSEIFLAGLGWWFLVGLSGFFGIGAATACAFIYLDNKGNSLGPMIIIGHIAFYTTILSFISWLCYGFYLVGSS